MSSFSLAIVELLVSLVLVETRESAEGLDSSNLKLYPLRVESSLSLKEFSGLIKSSSLETLSAPTAISAS
jgi:hypothetical protein